MSRAETRPSAGAEQRFRRTMAITLITLAALCLVFVGLGYLQGPRLSSAQVDPTGVIEQSDQQLRLFTDQAVAQVRDDQVTITPAVPFEVSTDGDVIALQFAERLDYDTEYSVSVAGVTSLYLAQPSTLDYRFTTASPVLHYLDRGEPDDSIVTTGLSGADRQVVYSAPRIQDFEVLDGFLAVVSLQADDTSALDFVNVDTDVVENLRLPDTGTIAKLDASSSGTFIGFTLTSADDGIGQLNSRTLFTVDLSAGRTVQPVLDLAGEPLHVLGWQFVPGTTQVLALSIDRSLLLIDPTTGVSTPLGQFQELDKVSVDGTSVTMTDTLGRLAVTLADGAQERLTPSPLDGFEGFLGSTAVLPDGNRVEKVVIPDETGTRFSTLLVHDDGTAARMLYRTVDDGGSISDFTVSPNGQYVAIETVPDASASVSDGYPVDARSTSVTTVVVDVATGAPVRSMEGFALRW